MTVACVYNKTVYAGDGSTRVFPFDFPVLHEEHIQLVLVDEDHVETTVDSSEYSVSLEDCTVTYPRSSSDAAVEEGVSVVVVRRLPLLQWLDLENQGPFEAEALERTYDKIVMMIQQLSEAVDRCVKTSVDEDSPEEFYAQMLANMEAAQAAQAAAEVAQAAAEELLSETQGIVSEFSEFVSSQAEAAATSADQAADSAEVAVRASLKSQASAEAAAESAEEAEAALEATREYVYMGQWDKDTEYALNNTVSYLGSSFISRVDGNVGNQPNHVEVTEAWGLLAVTGLAVACAFVDGGDATTAFGATLDGGGAADWSE